MSNTNKKLVVQDLKKSFDGAAALKPVAPKIKPHPQKKPQQNGSKNSD